MHLVELQNTLKYTNKIHATKKRKRQIYNYSQGFSTPVSVTE